MFKKKRTNKMNYTINTQNNCILSNVNKLLFDIDTVSVTQNSADVILACFKDKKIYMSSHDDYLERCMRNSYRYTNNLNDNPFESDVIVTQNCMDDKLNDYIYNRKTLVLSSYLLGRTSSNIREHINYNYKLCIGMSTLLNVTLLSGKLHIFLPNSTVYN